MVWAALWCTVRSVFVKCTGNIYTAKYIAVLQKGFSLLTSHHLFQSADDQAHMEYGHASTHVRQRSVDAVKMTQALLKKNEVRVLLRANHECLKNLPDQMKKSKGAMEASTNY